MVLSLSLSLFMIDTFEERYEHHKAKKRKLADDAEDETTPPKSFHASDTMATS